MSFTRTQREVEDVDGDGDNHRDVQSSVGCGDGRTHLVHREKAEITNAKGKTIRPKMTLS